jgi:hypothetical protein
MKILLVLATLTITLASPMASAETWVEVDETPNAHWYLDADSISDLDAETIRYSTRMTLKEIHDFDQAKGVGVVQRLQVATCANRSVSTIQSATFTREGKLLTEIKSDAAWFAPPPASIEAIIVGVACDQASRHRSR